MGHRTLVAYERSDGQYNLHYSHRGAKNLQLKQLLTLETPFGEYTSGNEWTKHVYEYLRTASDRGIPTSECGESQIPTRVEVEPCAVGLSLREIRQEYVDYLAHEAFYVVRCDDWQLRVRAYRVFWFGLEDVATTARRAPTVGHGALRTVTWRDGDPTNDEYVRGEFDALKAIVGDFLDRRVFASEGEALAYLERMFREWSADADVHVVLQ
ncbi:hypothetical protein MBEHAL_0802 [Halarchaeum acidiphilum MH1-52-1]|uniref:Uncharacterized protein n=1 Tax=Halarchaeum acidiphilum MH1-52-1 TaxID=1261545 RepID=U2YTG5_9EURY|nr:DUF6735 family protein [Halarchaeum acidiphilum]GAD52042.1 hypothetical protein MBEHAL_0802 [Halarchaeum acidiphilum MH1-52-1]